MFRLIVFFIFFLIPFASGFGAILRLRLHHVKPVVGHLPDVAIVMMISAGPGGPALPCCSGRARSRKYSRARRLLHTRLAKPSACQLIQKPPDFEDRQKSARRHHAHIIVMVAVKVSASCIDRDKVFRAARESALQKPIVRFVAYDAQFHQWMTDVAGFHNLSDEIGTVLPARLHIRRGWRGWPTSPQGRCEPVQTRARRRVSLLGNVANFRIQVSRTALKVRLGVPQGPLPAFGLDKLNRSGRGHVLAAVLAMSARQRRRKPEPNHFSFHNGCRLHVRKIAGHNLQNKPEA